MISFENKLDSRDSLETNHDKTTELIVDFYNVTGDLPAFLVKIRKLGILW
jgi:hypothetical protein